VSASVFRKAVRDRLKLIAISAAALAALTIGVIPIYASMAPQLQNLADVYPKELLLALGVEDLASPIGFLDAELFSLMFPIVLIGIGIVIGVSAIAGEEDSRTINVLLSHPVRRTAAAWAKVAAMIVLVGLLGAAIFGSLIVGNAIGELEIGAGGLFAASLMTALLGILFGSLAFAVGAATGRPGLSVGVAAGVALLAWVVDAFAPLIGGMDDVQKLSPLYWYTGTGPLTNGLDPLSTFLMVGVSAILFVGGVVAFDRRDIAV
jgi:ABC-2 type transport system permease protein